MKIKKEIGLNLWDKYKDRLHTDFFSDNGMLITRDQIRNSTRTSALFYTIYVVCTLIYCETDKELVKKYGKDGEEQKERMMLLCKQAIQMVSSFYDVMKNEQLDNIVDKHILSFEQKHEDKKELSKIFSGASIYSSTLTPMLLKASGLLTFYITQFPEREMGRFLDMAIEKRVNNGAQWLWEDSKYDLATTERYIEAILDFYDYYDKYEKTYLKTKIEVSEERQKVMDEIRPEVEAQVEKDLKEKHQAALQAQKAAHETELQKRVSEFKIEALIDEKIEHAIQTRTQEVIKAALDEIISANKNTHGENIPILSVTFREVIMSYFYKYAYRVRNNGDSQNGEDFTDEELMDIFNEDAEKFVQSWFLYLLDNNKQGNGMRWLFNYTKGDSKFLKNPEKK